MNILSIQSHVAFGHAGNSSAVFPLQRLGCNVWPVNTVMFSNHTGYDSWRGPVFSPENVRDVVQGIADLGAFEHCDAVLSGYMGDPGMAEVILDAVARAQKSNPDTIYCCDPVIGDIGPGVYVQGAIPGFFREKVIQHANIITPNHFELEILTGRKVKDLPQAMAAARQLMALGPEIVLVTSLVQQDSEPGYIEMLAVSHQESWLIKTPLLDFPTVMSGSGDATSAIFLARYLQTRDLRGSLEHVASAMYAVFDNTHKHQRQELMLIESQESLVNPPRYFTAYNATET
ncbi:MAG: pyridoxal kinase PdxY [Endozoicomonas sp.]